LASKREKAAPRRRNSREAIPESPNPIDIAMAAAASGKPLPETARRVLEEQAELLRAQRTELKLRHVGEVVRAALWAILAIVAFAFLALIFSLVIRAARSDALIVESFRVPPALGARGMSGEVVATQVLDKLAEMESKSDSIRAAKTYSHNWGDELKIDIPNTNATAEQLWRLLRGWLGTETRISGEVTQTPDGLTLTTRVSAKPGRTFVTKTGSMGDLTRQGAEYIYESTQPYRFAVYLSRDPARQNQWRSILERLTTDPSPIERKWAFNGLNRVADSEGKMKAALVFARRALSIDPEMYVARTNEAYALSALGRDQESADVYRSLETLAISDEYDPQMAHANRCADRALLGFLVIDPVMIDTAASCMRSSTRQGYSDFGLGSRAYADVMRHDPTLAAALRPSSFQWLPPILATASAAEANLRAAMLSGPSPSLASAYEAFTKASRERADANAPDRALQMTIDWPLRAEALATLGRTAEAQAVLAKTPLTCYGCLRVRGLVARAEGKPMDAQRWFQRAAQQGPRLAPAFLEWGKLLLEYRRYVPAEPKIRRAAELAPNWADPLKYWGDLLAAQGKREEALEKYDAALELAPNWAELKRARARFAS
jgi:tetratricopeptide (TPR) repeat protein